MNVGGGEAADQMVRMMLSGTEVAVRLSGSALKNLLALTMALALTACSSAGDPTQPPETKPIEPQPAADPVEEPEPAGEPEVTEEDFDPDL